MEPASPFLGENGKNGSVLQRQAQKRAVEDNLECPKCRNNKCSKSQQHKQKSCYTLEVSIHTHGFAKKVLINCSVCNFRLEVNPIDVKQDHQEKSSFLKYGINYEAVLMMQHLGMGIKSLGPLIVSLVLLLVLVIRKSGRVFKMCLVRHNRRWLRLF
jgi:hypothetical protein